MTYDYSHWSQYPEPADLHREMLEVLDEFRADLCQPYAVLPPEQDRSADYRFYRTLFELHQLRAITLDATIEEARIFLLPGACLEQVWRGLRVVVIGDSAIPAPERKTRLTKAEKAAKLMEAMECWEKIPNATMADVADRVGMSLDTLKKNAKLVRGPVKNCKPQSVDDDDD